MRVALFPLFMAIVISPGHVASAQCTGDCDHNYIVSITDMIVGVNIALGLQQVSACQAFDSDGNGNVDVAELITGVNNLLENSCIPITHSERIFGNPDSDTIVTIPVCFDLTFRRIELKLDFSPDPFTSISECHFNQTFAVDIQVGFTATGYFADIVAQEGLVTAPQGDEIVCSFHVGSSAGTLELQISGAITLESGQQIPISGSGSGEIFANTFTDGDR